MVYEEGSEQLLRSNLLTISAKQIERVTNAYGLLSEQYSSEETEQLLSTTYPLASSETTNPLYCMLDGSMVLTRESSWKEVKLCRFFSEEDRIALSPSRTQVRSSTYVGHLGSINGFFEKLEGMSSHLEKAVFIADGAKWIWNWVNAHYPNSVQILDFYHSKEKLCEFARLAIEQEEERKNWVGIQTQLLLDEETETLFDNINSLKIVGRKVAQQRRSLCTYFKNNQDRMRYKTYKEEGYLIGSGAIEAAHRTIIQSRMKKAGQRWSKRGAQNVLNLRTLNKSGRWQLIKNLILN